MQQTVPWGAILETAVLSEIVKTHLHRGGILKSFSGARNPMVSSYSTSRVTGSSWPTRSPHARFMSRGYTSCGPARLSECKPIVSLGPQGHSAHRGIYRILHELPQEFSRMLAMAAFQHGHDMTLIELDRFTEAHRIMMPVVGKSHQHTIAMLHLPIMVHIRQNKQDRT